MSHIRNASGSTERDKGTFSGMLQETDAGVFFGQLKVRLWLPDEPVAELHTLG